MTKKIFFAFLTLLVIIFFFLIVIFFLTASWLNTYRAFTNKTEIATITISEPKQDDLGFYSEVELVQYQPANAVKSIFIYEEEKKDPSVIEKFKLYGDEISIDGPFLKMKDIFLLNNFENAYKLARLRSEYNDPVQERNRDNQKMPSSYALNGGFADWKNINETFESTTPLGFWYRFLFETYTIQSSGVFQPSKQTVYKIFVTSNGFTFDKQ